MVKIRALVISASSSRGRASAANNTATDTTKVATTGVRVVADTLPNQLGSHPLLARPYNQYVDTSAQNITQPVKNQQR